MQPEGEPAPHFMPGWHAAPAAQVEVPPSDGGGGGGGAPPSAPPPPHGPQAKVPSAPQEHSTQPEGELPPHLLPAWHAAPGMHETVPLPPSGGDCAPASGLVPPPTLASAPPLPPGVEPIGPLAIGSVPAGKQQLAWYPSALSVHDCATAPG